MKLSLKGDGVYTSVTFFYQFFILALISDFAVLGINPTLMPALCVPFLAAFTTWVSWIVFRLIKGRKKAVAELNPMRKICIYIYLGVILLVQNFLIITDYFLLVQFHTLISQQSIDLLFGTNAKEAIEFVTSYIPFWVAILVIAVVVLFNYGIYRLAILLSAKFEGSRIERWFRYVLIGGGMAIVGFMLFYFAKYHHGAQIPTFTSYTRLGYGYFQRIQNIKRTDRLISLCINAEASMKAVPDFDIVFVLGESYARHHTPLYGYDKNTTPGQMKLLADSSLIVFSDVVTIEDWTQKVLMSLFSTGRYNSTFGQYPLFPVLLRKAGWRTELYENEFPLSHDTFFFNRPDLSEQMFDYRDDNITRYDDELAARMTPSEEPAFHMLHFMGQHFQYIDRFPEGYGRFTPEDYDSSRFTDAQRKILANYDNATLYNDSVFCSVVERWADRDAVIIYFTDHGEEIFDCRDYFGHGNAASASDISYQIKIPFMIYGSKSFRENHPQLWETIERAADYPISTDDISHFFLDLAGVETPTFDPTRSFINEQYNVSQPRIVLNSIDFNSYH